MSIIALFCEIHDFFLAYEKWIATQCLPEGAAIETRGRPRNLHPSEVMTLLIAFHQSGYRTLVMARQSRKAIGDRLPPKWVSNV